MRPLPRQFLLAALLWVVPYEAVLIPNQAARTDLTTAPRQPPSSTAQPGHADPAAGLPSSPGSSGTVNKKNNTVTSLAHDEHQPTTQRALSVLVLASAALIGYFVIRTVRLRRRNRKTRRYGVLDTNIENMELTPLEQEDEDDDTTLFDAHHPRR